MGVMDKFLNYMRLNDDEEGGEYDDDFLDDEEEVQSPRKTRTASKLVDEEPEYDERAIRRTSQPKVTPIRPVSNKRTASAGGMQVCVIKPTSIEEAREVTQTLLANQTVVLNLEGLDVEIAQRIIDFTSGSCYAINGNLQKISNFIFIITPASVDISGDFTDVFNAAGGTTFEMSLGGGL